MTLRAFALLFTVVASLVSVSELRAQVLPYRLDTLSAWGGSVNGFERVGNIGYCGSGQRFVVLDMSNEANIQELGSVHMSTTVGAIAVRGSVVYVCSYSPSPQKFSVIDISVPSAPRIIWSQSSTPPGGVLNGATRIQFYGNLMYVLNGNDLRVFDISVPGEPASRLTGPPNSNYYIVYDLLNNLLRTADFQIIGDLLYQADSDGYLRVFNLQPDPLHPVNVGSAQVGYGGSDMRLDVANGSAIVQSERSDPTYPSSWGHIVPVAYIVDVSVPTLPVVRSIYDQVFYTGGVAIQGNVAFVADWLFRTTEPPTFPWLDRLKGLAILDISNPSTPVLIGTYNTNHSSIHDVRVSGNRAYLSCAGQGLVILDITNPAQPSRIGGHYSPGSLRIMTKAGNRLYAVDEFNGFTILDVSNPASTPGVIGVYRAPVDYRHLGFWNLQIRKNLAYLSAGHGGIQVVDVSNAALPTLVHQYTQLGASDFDVHAVELDGNILHATYNAAPGGLCYANFDISTAPSVTPIGAPLPLPLSRFGNVPPHRLTTKHGISFCGGSVHFIDRVDTRNPLNPAFLRAGWDPWGGTDFELVGNFLYGANGGAGKVDIVDVTDAASQNLTPLGSYQLDQPSSIGMVGSRAHLSNSANSDGLSALDCSTPTTPSVTAVSPIATASDIIAEGALVYAALSDPAFGTYPYGRGGVVVARYGCYANCDESSANPVLTANDFQCFLNKYAAGDAYANCDRSPMVPVLTANDFQCFINMFVTGCN
jgi:hypothetical protein